MDAITLLIILTCAAILLLATVLWAVVRRKATPEGQALHVADRLHGLQTTIQSQLAQSSKEFAEQRTGAAQQSKQLEVAMLERLARFEKELRESVAAAGKEVKVSKEAVDKNALEMTKFMAAMGQTIEKLSNHQAAAAKVSEDLRFLLEGPKSRGTFGETILEELLERLLPRALWELQYRVEGREAVDAAVLLKGTAYPIDAKFPKEDYQRFLQAKTPEEKNAHWKRHVAAVKTQIDSISRKYVKPSANTSQFAMMFIPSESMYYDTVADVDHNGDQNGLVEYAQSKNVVPVGPTTLYAFLMVISKAQEGQRLIDSAKILQVQMAKLRVSFDHFFDRYDETGKFVQKAAEAFRKSDDHAGRLKERMDSLLSLEFEGSQSASEIAAIVDAEAAKATAAKVVAETAPPPTAAVRVTPSSRFEDSPF